MLLKTIRTPIQIATTLNFIGDNITPAGVEAIRQEFYEGKGILPVLSHESVKPLSAIWDLYRVCPETKQIGDFAGDLNLPHNCVAVLIHKANHATTNISIEYITSDIEAYIISDAGVTVTVINGKKAVEGWALKEPCTQNNRGQSLVVENSGKVTINGGDIKMTTPQLNIHQGTTTSETGPAK